MEPDKMRDNSIFRRNRIKGAGREEVLQLARLTRQYTRLAGEAGRNIFQVMSDSVSKYIEWRNRYLLPKEKRDYTLNFPMLHKTVRKEIGLEPAAVG